MNKNDLIATYAESASNYREKWQKAESEKKELLKAYAHQALEGV